VQIVVELILQTRCQPDDNTEQKTQKKLYDEQYKRMDGRMVGRWNVALDDNRRGGRGPAGRRDWQAVQEIIMLA